MSGKAVGWAFEREGLTTSQKFTLVALADNASDDGTCWPSQTHLAEKTGLSPRTVRRALVDLETIELVSRHSRMRLEGRGRSSDLYRLDLPATVTGKSSDHPSNARLTNRPLTTDQPAIDDDQPATVTGAIYEPSKEPSGTETTADVVRARFDRWVKATDRDPARTKLTKGRRRAVAARLAEGYEPELIDRAIDNVAASPWHRGENDRHRPFDDLTGICANGERLESYAAMTATKPMAMRTGKVDAAREAIAARGRRIAELQRLDSPTDAEVAELDSLVGIAAKAGAG